MDPEFIDYYQRQLTYIQGAFSEFAQEHPKIAARLGAQAGDVRDPHVARLLEAFAWSAARSEQRIDRWPLELPLRILDGIDLNVTAPLPSLGVVRFRPDAAGAHTATGLRLARGTTVTMGQPVDGQSECRFLTTQTFTLWPLSISRVKLTGIPADIPALYRYLRDGQDVRCVRGALRLRLSTHRGTLLSELETLDRLPVYLCGEERMASQLFELLHTSVVGMVMGVPGEFETGELYGIDRPGLPAMRVAYEGLEPDESLVRPVLPKWHGQRLVHDFFALQERFWFFTLTGLAAGLKHVRGPEVEIVLLLSREVAMLDQQVNTEDFALYCTPVANLFPANTERAVLDPTQRTHPLRPTVEETSDYEVHSVDRAFGQVDENSPSLALQPLDVSLRDDTHRDPRYFRLIRDQDLVTGNARRYETRQQFIQTRTSIRLYDAQYEPDDTGITILELNAWLTNGDLPCVLPRNGEDALILKNTRSVKSVSFVRGPTPPRAPLACGSSRDVAWELVRQLQLPLNAFDDEFNEPEPGKGLRLRLAPFQLAGDPTMARFLESLCGATASPVYAMHRCGDDITPTRGIAVTLTFDESLLDGYSPFTFALALERYVARHVSQHSFTRTTLRTLQRGTVFTWPTRSGTRGIL